MAKKSQLKLPPHNEDAEKAVLGSILIDKNAIIKVADMIAPKDFYMPAHEKIFEVILDLFDKRKPIDITSVSSRLKELELLGDVGGSAYLAELTNQVATASHVDHYAATVKEKKVRRDLIRISAETTEDAFEPTIETEDLIDNTEQKMLAISQKFLPQNFIHIKGELKGAYERIEKMQSGENALRGIPTGFDDLDKLLSGLQKSDLIVVGARPSFGKTAFVLDIARHAAVKANIPVGIFSLEMAREQVIDRIISAESGVPLWRILTGRLNEEEGEFGKIQEALDRLSRVSIFIEDSPSLNVMQMRSMARRLQVEQGLGLLVVDYLQLITPRNNRSDNMVQQVTEISRGLKSLARELQVPVLAVSQLSRAVDQRDNKVPRLSDLRESGSIEQDSDVVLFLYRKDRDRGDTIPQEEQNIAQINIAKHRNGPVGSITLRFDPEHVTFRPLERRYDAADSVFDEQPI